MIESTVLFERWSTTMWCASWQGSLVVLAVWSICRLIPSMSAKFHCWFWRLAILKFTAVLLLPFALDVPLLPAPATHEIDAPLGLSVAVSDTGQAATRQTQTQQLSPYALLCLGWGIGVGWNLTRLLVAWRAVRRLRSRSHPVECAVFLERLAFCRSLFGLRSEPQLLGVAGCGSPVLVGILRPAIVVPAETRRRLNASEQVMVLAHELAHIRRGDLVWTLVAALVRCVFFFHPLVWLSERRLKMAQEIAADELAIAHQDHDPVRYGKLLVSVLSKLGSSRVIPTTSLGTAGPIHSLKKRLSAMSFYGQVSRRVVVTSRLLLGAVVLPGLMPWNLVAAESHEDATKSHAGKDRRMQRQVTVNISEGEKGKPMVLLSAPTIVFSPNKEAKYEIRDNTRRLEVTVRTLPDRTPMTHTFAVKLFKTSEGEKYVLEGEKYVLEGEKYVRKGEKFVLLSAPTIHLTDGATGKFRVEGSAVLEIEATVKPVE